MNLVDKFPSGETLPQARPYANHIVSPRSVFTAQDRETVMERTGWNVFNFPSKMVILDYLSDSGTTTMTNKQWAAMLLGDEAYGSNEGYFELADVVREVFGAAFFNEPGRCQPNAFIFHQGRSAENTLFQALGKIGPDLMVPSNGHFDTTRANICAHRLKPFDFFSSELKAKDSNSRFKGNMNVSRLKKFLTEHHNHVPLVFLTITNNTGGGQPVSMKNIAEVSELAHSFGIPLFFDACRFAENAWFIKHFEPYHGYRKISDIVHEMFSYVDGFTISFKKDGLVNMGGGLFLRHNGLFVKKYPRISEYILDTQIRTEGHPTYGGLAGRDLKALAVGLKTVVSCAGYLDHRIGQVRQFGQMMRQAGLPVIWPPGGHALYLDMDDFFKDTAMQPADFGGISLTAVLLACYGYRACELGNFAFGHYDPATKTETLPDVNYVRFAVPRLRYERQDLEATAAAVKTLYDHRDQLPAVEVVRGRDRPLRHFKAAFRLR